MTIPFEQLLNLPDIRVLSVEMKQDSIKCDIESTQGYALCHQCGQRASKFFESGATLHLRHLPICERQVTLYLHTKRYRCQSCQGRITTTERGTWYDPDAQCTKPFANALLRALVKSTMEAVADTHARQLRLRARPAHALGASRRGWGALRPVAASGDR